MKIEKGKKYRCKSDIDHFSEFREGKIYLCDKDNYLIDATGTSRPVSLGDEDTGVHHFFELYDEPKTPDKEPKAPAGMMPFDIEKAKAGTKVIARYGEPVRILCYDLQNEKCIAAAVLWKEGECVYSYLPNGKYYTDNDNVESPLDLFHPEPEIWTNLYTTEYDNRYSDGLFRSKIEALKNIIETDSTYIGTYKLVKE